jgi:serine/threonine protein kinase/tetratricopeptide (TPR) repeat protein
VALATRSRLGPYELVSPIGAGGMGEVYRAHDPRLGRDVAIKILPTAFSSDAQRLRRFEQEAHAAAALNHPNLLAVYDIGTQDGSPYIVSELLEGETLRERLRSGALPVRKAVDYAVQIARGLAAAHDKGIVHRDLKPENIFLTRDGQLKILDFGLAKLARPEAGGTDMITQTIGTGSSTILGTVAYMSPEQVRGKPADARSDLFAFGAVVYEMLYGERAFQGDTPADTMTSVLTREPRKLMVTNVHVPTALDHIVRHCLEKSPEARFQSARDVTFDLESLSASLSTEAVEVTGAASLRTGKKMLAVRPFENLSRDQEQEYFSDGLTEEMITQLARLNPERLGVIARTSAMRYKGTTKSIREIGAELGVNYILEGSVRRSGKRVRITAQLVQVSDETHLWAESYERSLNDILKLQVEVSRAIAKQTRVKLAPREERRLAHTGEVSPEAYEAYLKGRHLWNKRTEESMRKSVALYEQALASYPEYAMAYAGIADSYVMLACRGMAPAKETFRKAKIAARKALELDSELGEAQASLAHVRLHDWDWGGLEKDFQRAIELNPANAIVYYWYGEFLMSLGRPEQAIAITEKAYRTDPLSPVIASSLAMIFYLARRFDSAVQVLERALEINPDHFLPHLRIGLVYVQRREYDKAIAELKTAVRLADRSTETQAALALAYSAAGRKKLAQEIIAELEEPSAGRYVLPYNVARIHAAAGNKEKALEWLERAYDEGNADLIELNSEPVFDVLRKRARFIDVMRRVGWNVASITSPRTA